MSNLTPITRNEEILEGCIDGEEITKRPISRAEEYLEELSKSIKDKEIVSAQINESGHLILETPADPSIDCGIAKGSDGTDGKDADQLVPDYVKSEADATIAKANNHGNLGKTIRFIAFSDAHNDSNGKATTTATGTILNPELTRCVRQGNKHCGQAINYIANRIGIDFVAFLGDGTWAAIQGATYTQAELMNDIFEMWDDISDGFKGLPQIRCVGNHDEYLTGDNARLWNSGAYNLFGRYCSGSKNNPGGYGYLDLDSCNVRIIYLNTSDAPSQTNAGTLLTMSQEQLNWLAETLLDTGDKTGWKCMVFSHAPLDLINCNDVLTAYANGTTYGTYDFASHNSAQIIANVHGHTHCYNVGYESDRVRRFTIPNSCYADNNHYGGRTGYEAWADATTYAKTPDSGDDTAFSLVTIDLDTNIAYVDNYGSGIDREFSCDYYAVPNLFDKNDPDVLIGGRINSSNNRVYMDVGQLLTGYIPASNGETFTVTTDEANSKNVYTGELVVYDENKAFISKVGYSDAKWTWSADYKSGSIDLSGYTGAAYVCFCLAYTDIDSIVVTKE